MTDEPLIKVDEYSTKIRLLNILRRIEIEYPILVRDSVAKKLADVAEKLLKEFSLQIDCGYRSLGTQDKLWKARQNKLTQNLTFDPKIGTPPHTTGGAVDVALQDLTGHEINLCSPLINYYNESQFKSNKISKRSQELRNMLRKLMLSEGFAPNEKEYWHFSYGDEDWARYYNKKILYHGIKNYKLQKFNIFKILLIKLLLKTKNLLRGDLGN